MRTLRPLLAGTISACLFGGLAVAVRAQDETPLSPTPVTGTVTQAWTYSRGTGYTGSHESMEDGVFVGLGIVDHQEVAWSDPRLPSDHWMRMDYRIFGMDEPDGVMTVTTSHLLIDDEGTWRGSGRVVEDADSRYSTYELVGEGAYEGLYALLQGTRGADAHGPWDESYEGVIFEGSLPPFPEPAEPLDTEGWQRLPFPSPPPEASTGRQGA